jgi:hypothetical protein
MNKISKSVKTILLSFMLLFAGSNLYAQGPTAPPADPSLPDGGTVNSPVGGGAPLGTGLCILISLAAAYGLSNFLQYRKSKNEDIIQ